MIQTYLIPVYQKPLGLEVIILVILRCFLVEYEKPKISFVYSHPSLYLGKEGDDV